MLTRRQEPTSPATGRYKSVENCLTSSSEPVSMYMLGNHYTGDTMTLKEIWRRLNRTEETSLEFEEFEELMNDWAWNEFNRQKSVTGDIYKPEPDNQVQGF